jgi:RNA polymerase sigma factor (sigma-70 family)
MSDQKLISSIRGETPDRALAVLYAHFPMVRSNVLKSGGSPQDAEDIFQESLIILCRNVRRPDFVLTSKLSTYLFGIARNIWNQELRSRQKPVPPEDPMTSDWVEREKRARLAEKILDELGERCKELLLLFYSGASIRKVTVRMGYTSENSAKNQKFKCLERARNQYKSLTHA